MTGKEGYYKNNILWDKKNNFFNKISLEIFSLFFLSQLVMLKVAEAVKIAIKLTFTQGKC